MTLRDDQVQELAFTWRRNREIPYGIRVWRQQQDRKHVFTHETTSCAQWKVYIYLDHPQAESAFAELVRIFQLAITAGPHVLNNLVWGQPCPLASCTCCDNMDLQLTIDVDTFTTNKDLDVASVFNRALYHWDASKESSKFRELRDVLLSYPQHADVPPMRLTLSLYRHDLSSSGRMDNHHLHMMSVERLLEQAAISLRNGGYDVRLQWFGHVSKCSASNMCLLTNQQQVSLCMGQQADVQLDDNDRICPIHQLNHLCIVLIDGEVSTYIPTRLWNFKMECGGCPEVVLLAAPAQDAKERAGQIHVVCKLNTAIMLKYIKVSYGRVELDNNGLIMVVWNENPLTNGAPQPMVMNWYFSCQISTHRLYELLALVGPHLRQLKIISVGYAVVTIMLSQLVMILDQCPLLEKISVYGLGLDSVESLQQHPLHQSHFRYKTVPKYPRIRVLKMNVTSSLDAPTSNSMISSILMLVGPSLQRLRLSNHLMDAMTARTIARTCPHLRALRVHRVDDSFCPALLDAFDQGQGQLSKLKALTVSFVLSKEDGNRLENGDYPLLVALQDPHRAITRSLREFSVGDGSYQYRSVVTERIMRKLLDLNDTLVNVHLWRTPYHQLDKHIVRGASGTIPLRHVCALLSGLPSIRVLYQFPIELIQNILAFTGRNRPAYRIGILAECRRQLN